MFERMDQVRETRCGNQQDGGLHRQPGTQHDADKAQHAYIRDRQCGRAQMPGREFPAGDRKDRRDCSEGKGQRYE